jgi:predicted DNA-binding transcriptional regulator YafY
MLEMCWHLFTWGPGVEVTAPTVLRDRYVALLDAARKTAGAPRRRHDKGR